MKKVFEWFTRRTAVIGFIGVSLLFLCYSVWEFYAKLYDSSPDTKFEALKIAQRILSNFAAGIFMLLWWHLKKRYPQQDFSLYFFSWAMLAWGVPSHDWFSETERKIYFSLFYSTLNNVFFLFAYRDLEHGSPNYAHQIFKELGIERKNYYQKVGWFGLMLLLGVLLLAFFDWQRLALSLDILVSAGVIVWMAYGFVTAFRERFQVLTGFLMTFYAIAVSLTMLASQMATAYHLYHQYRAEHFGELFANKHGVSVLAAVLGFTYNITFIFLLGALAFSWALQRFINQLEIEKQQAYFQREDMIHVVRNSLDFFEDDLKDLERFQQQEENPSATATEFYRETATRVSVLCQIFRMMHQTTQGVPLQAYLENLMEKLDQTFKFKHLDTSQIDLKSLGKVPEPSAQKLAKVLVELLMNSYKYGGQWAKLQIWVERGSIRARIEDRGEGFKNGNKSARFGSKLIEEYLEKDLKGTCTRSNLADGALVELSIPTTKFKINENFSA